MLFIVFFSVTVSYTQCANILGVFMYPSMNHQIIFQQIWKELSLRGHQVTVVTPDPLNDPSLTNLTEISVRFAYDVLKEHKAKDPFFEPIATSEELRRFYHLLDLIAERELSSPAFKTLLYKEKKFDLILIELIHPVMYILAHKFNAPVIAISASSTFNVYYDAVGNPNHPVLYPDPSLTFNFYTPLMWRKFKSLKFFIWYKIYYHYFYLPKAQQIAETHFGNNIPYVGDLERNVSMVFINRNLVLDKPRPNVPAVVEFSPLNAKTIKNIPKDLKNTLDDAKNGVIYFNLGRNFTCNYLQNKFDIFTEAFSELPYQFLWKWNCDFAFANKLSNIIIKKSLPHQSFITHPNIKAMVTEGGVHDIEEAVTYEVPLVSFYVRNEPPYTRRILELGIGTELNLERLTKVELKNVLTKIVEKKSYKENIIKVSKILLDQPMTGLDKVIWWSEHVIRSKGAKHLRSAAIDMPMYEFLLLDVLLFLSAIFLLVVYLSYKFITLMLKFLLRKQRHDKLKKN